LIPPFAVLWLSIEHQMVIFIKFSFHSFGLNELHPFLMGASINLYFKRPSEPFHCAQQSGEMIRSKIVVQQRLLVPLLLKGNKIAFVGILKKKAAFATGNLKSSFCYVLTCLQKFAPFVITGTDFNQEFFHDFIRLCEHLIKFE